MPEKTELTDLLTYGIDIKNRRIYFGLPIDSSEEVASDFTMSSVELAIRALHKMADDSNKPIEIHMSSYGGDPYAMLRLHDEILASPCQIKFFGGGAIMSAATWIMAVADERYLHENAKVMLHDGWEDPGVGKHTDLLISAKEAKVLQARLYEIYAKNSKMPVVFWQDVCQRDLFLTAQEAIILGLADKIIEPKKRGNLRKLRQATFKTKTKNQDMRNLLNEIYGRINRVKVPKIDFNKFEAEQSDPNIIVTQVSEVPSDTQPSGSEHNNS